MVKRARIPKGPKFGAKRKPCSRHRIPHIYATKFHRSTTPETMDAAASSRKRNRSYGTCTRSRSQLSLHRSRSGQLRFDPAPTHHDSYAELARLRSTATSPKKPKNSDGDGKLPRPLTKDLRARRVYSPPQSRHCDDSDCADRKELSAEATETPDLGLSCAVLIFDRGNTRALDERRNLQDPRGKNGGDCSEIIEGLDDTTLPDAETGCGSMVNEDERKREAEAAFKDTPVTDSKKNDSAFKSKSVRVPRPRFQVKLFKAPGSVNYRRLFPFLMDAAGGDSGTRTPQLGFCQKDEGDEGYCNFLCHLKVMKLQKQNSRPMVAQCSDKCLSESKVDAAADNGVKDVGSDLPDDDTKQLSMANLTESISHDDRHVKSMDSTRSTRENAGEGFCQKADKRKDSIKMKSVPRQHLHRKLFKTPGSVSYKRLLPFITELAKDVTGTSKVDHQTHHQNIEADMRAKRFQLPLSSQRGEAFIDEHRADSSPTHDTIEFNSLENYVLVNPSNELSQCNQLRSTTPQDRQMDAKEVFHKGLSTPSVNEHIEKFVIDSKDECSELNPCSVMMDDFYSAKNVVNVEQIDGFEEAENKMSTQHNSESPPKDQNMLNTNGEVSGLIFEHHSCKEKGCIIDHDESTQFVNPEEREYVGRCPPDVQSLSQLDPHMVDAEKNRTSSHAIFRSDNRVVLNHVRISTDILRSPSDKITSVKSDMAGHSGDKAVSVLKGIYGSQTENDPESKITSVLKRCPRIKLLKQAGSLNYKRLLPFFLDTMENNSCASVNDHYPKLPKSMDQTRLQLVSTSNISSVSDSNGCVPVEHCADNSGTQQQIGLLACDLNNDTSSTKSLIPEFQSSHDSCQLIQPPDKQIVLHGLCKPEEKATPVLSNSSVFPEVKENSSFLISCNEKSPETPDCCKSMLKLKVAEQLGVPADGFRKGILKRNPRGCRGLCTCLNCVSFRLHAERAFEFSRNQLLEAEEVAGDLMKELSLLRSMLERSADSVNNNPVFDGSQVKEACRKAFAAEELAKDRFSQMNDDLNIHCRITRLQPPSVTFAVHVEEKVIQPDG
ncbi:hypothetical protein Fmac_004779 [Flemingia macrophylla]|uniref:Uncharacterized protein n=1 Tax=Flemingia macrophylla TaxID=520843 RepID=A0ABD1N5V5_9FABA